VFAAVVLIFSQAALATSFEHLTLARLARTAQIIVRARCVSNSARWDGGEIWTITTWEEIELWKGSTSGLITVRLLGGTVGSVTSNVSGVPRFRPGEDVILFLEPLAQGDYSVESWGQGTFRVYRDPKSGHSLVTQDTVGFSTFDPKSRRFVTTANRAVEISKFRAQVAASLLGTKGENE
jgi:hypothetical protein